MTIKLPKKTLADKFLILLGKKRGVIIPVINRQMGSQGVHFRAKFENFWVVLFRSKKSPLPNGVIDPDELGKDK